MSYEVANTISATFLRHQKHHADVQVNELQKLRHYGELHVLRALPQRFDVRRDLQLVVGGDERLGVLRQSIENRGLVQLLLQYIQLKRDEHKRKQEEAQIQ
jgi:hypothetical protein